VRPGGFAVLAHSNDPAANGMLPSVAATFSTGLVNSKGDIEVSIGAANDKLVLDVVKWTSVAPGVTRQLDPRHLTISDNDDAGSANYCPGTAPYGDPVNKGSPGAANAPCP
jgi:hypothetical protein